MTLIAAATVSMRGGIIVPRAPKAPRIPGLPSLLLSSPASGLEVQADANRFLGGDDDGAPSFAQLGMAPHEFVTPDDDLKIGERGRPDRSTVDEYFGPRQSIHRQ